MPELRKADPEARRRAVLTILIATAVGVLVIFAFEQNRQVLEDWLLADPETAKQRAGWLLLLLAALLQLPTIGFAIYLWSIAGKILRAREYPPPGLAVIRDTPVVTGTAAEARGRQLRLLATGLVIAGLVFSLLLWRLAAILG